MSSTNRGSNRRTLDAYYTPDDLARALVGTLRDHGVGLQSSIIEPHVGGGAFVRALRWAGYSGPVAGCDLNPHAAGLNECTSQWPGDFLDCDWKADLIVGNPPFAGFERHVDHALTRAPQVAFLLRLAVMESRGRVDCWKRWPLSAVYVLAERPSFTGGGTDSAAYGWFIFDRRSSGMATIVPGWSWK